MAVVYMLAFSSLYVQTPGLYGNDGVAPVRLAEPWTAPSLLWLGLTPGLGVGLDAPQLMELMCLLGALLALGAASLAPLRGSVVFFVLWAIYFSLSQIGRDLLSSPWDDLLLEAGFLAILVAPLCCQALPRRHDPMTFWLTRWLLFRLTFGSGVAKLAGHSAPWWNLSAVSHMLESQASPTPLAWWAAQLPAWVLRLATVGVLVSQVMVPLLYFAPVRCLRLGAFYIQLVYQVLSALTGNLMLVNVLTVALSFSLLDTEHTCPAHGKRKRAKNRRGLGGQDHIVQNRSLYVRGCLWKLWALVQWGVFASATVAMFAISVVPYTSMEPWSSSKVIPEVKRAHEFVKPYRLVSSYALDRRLDAAGGRPELVLEGSMDRDTWTEIDWMYKMGNVSAAPLMVGPCEARLDWHMWKAAGGRAQDSAWFSGLLLRLLQGNKEVERLLQTEQARYVFSKEPPAYLRARLYKSGPKQWWRRDFVKEFHPMVHLGELQAHLSQHGLTEKSLPQSSTSASLLAQILGHLRGHVESLPVPYVQWALLATVATICVLKCVLSGSPGGRPCGAPPAEPKPKKAKSQAAPGSKAPAGPQADRELAVEKRPDSERSPRRRK
ncbi:hypothetical protein CRUP_015253 [Coryphaenoides rupestris]|nr:hypothetical protein CRUP_015253 [Coryphaenoides rupestris]